MCVSGFNMKLVYIEIISIFLLLIPLGVKAETDWTYDFENDSWEDDWYVSHGNITESNGYLVSSDDCYNLTDWGCWNSMWRNQTDQSAAAYGQWKFSVNADNATQYGTRPVLFFYFVGNGKDSNNIHADVGYNMRINVIQNKIPSSWRDPNNPDATGTEGIYYPSDTELQGWLDFVINRFSNGTIQINFNEQKIIEYNNTEVVTSEYVNIEMIQGVMLDNLTYTATIPHEGSDTTNEDFTMRPYFPFYSVLGLLCVVIYTKMKLKKTIFN